MQVDDDTGDGDEEAKNQISAFLDAASLVGLLLDIGIYKDERSLVTGSAIV